MSFLKKLGFGNSAEQKPTNQTDSNPSAMQSMYNFDEKKQVIPERSYEAESNKPTKPPVSTTKATGKGSMFSNMKVKKTPTEEKKQEPAIVVPNNNTYTPPTIQESQVQPYKSPDIPQKEEQPTQLPSFFKQKQSSQVESSDRQSVPVYIRPTNPPIKRKNSSNSAAEPELPTKQSPSKKSTQTYNAPPKSATGKSIARTNSKSSLEKKQEIPVRRKSEASLDEVKQIQIEMLRAKERIVEKMKIQKDIKNKIMDETESLVALKERQDESIQKQNAAVEAEDYDKAAELEEQLSELKQQISLTETQLIKLERDFTEAEENICTEYIREEEQKVIFKKRLVRAKVQAQKVYDFVMKTETQKIQLQRGKTERDRKKLSSLQTQISFNEQKIKELQHQYEQDLNNQTQLFKDQKDDLSRRKLLISDDIRDLENRLQQKREELIVVDGELELADSNIDEVKRGFENEYRKIVQRKDKLYEMEIQRDEFSLGLGQLEKLTEQQVKSLDHNLHQMKQNISFITEQSQEYNDDNKFKQKLEKRKKAFEVFLAETSKVKGFQNQMKGKQDKVKQIEFKKSSLSLEISLLDSKKKELKQKIPQLESEKIVLVSGKNFKGAQAKSTEIKEANDQLVLLSSQIEMKFEQEKKVDKQYLEAQEVLDSQKETENRLKIDLARSQFELELLRFDDLTMEKLALSKYTSEHKDQLLSFVDSEIEELKEELEFLKSEYGLSKPEEQSPEKQKTVQTPQKPPAEKSVEPKQQQPSVEYQHFNQQQDNSRYGYISASPLQDTNQQQKPQPAEDQNEENSSQNPVEQEHNPVPSQNAVTTNSNERSEEESVEEVGYQPANF